MESEGQKSEALQGRPRKDKRKGDRHKSKKTRRLTHAKPIPGKRLIEKHEKFAFLMVTRIGPNGEAPSATAIYRELFPTANAKTAAKRASDLSRKPGIIARMADIRKEVFADETVDAQWIFREFKKRYQANVADYWKTIEIDADGNEYELGAAPKGVPTKKKQVAKRLDELTKDQQLLLDGYTVEQTVKGAVRTTFELSKGKALDAMARHKSFYNDKVDLTTAGKPIAGIALMGLTEISNDELDRRIRDIESGKAQEALPD